VSTLETDVRAGLTASPKDIPPKWFYDDRGSALFDDNKRIPQ
jgi:L-histidine N-alpha-methyltransferase